ncbi:MAG: AhpC/TSA family protein [Bacteroidales bacterium]|jgi:peroxiredoxin|nr:AhpC/TSA family protein [Bacteroidales bacterium]
MKKVLYLLLTALVAVSCNQAGKIKISASIKGADTSDVILSRLDINKIVVLDTIRTDEKGKFEYKFDVRDKENPDFYYLSMDRHRFASLILKEGDKVKVFVDGDSLRIVNSGESELQSYVDRVMADDAASFDSMAESMIEAINDNDKKSVEDLQAKVTKLYVDHKRKMIRSIIANPYSLSNIPILYQKFNDSLPVFAQANDVVIYRRVYDSLNTVYPESPYVKALGTAISQYDNYNKLADKIKDVKQISFPELSLPDMDSRTRNLSAFAGKPFILLFWSASDPKQKMFNQDLKLLYDSYEKRGLRVYAVSLDEDKSLWASTVREQNLPWVNVCDGLGASSVAATTFNVTSLPTLFVFNGKGTIVAKNVFDMSQLKKIIKKAL